MGSPSELSLDYKPSGYSAAQKPCADQPEHPHKLEEFLARLEEERLKIEAFKRELPLCMQLLNNAMEAYRQQLEVHNTNQGPRPVLEQFIPLKHATNTSDVSERMPPAVNVPCEKAGWMTTAQLWSPADGPGSLKQHAAAPFKDAADPGLDANPKLALDTGRKQRNGGAFLPFTRDRGGRGSGAALPELALAPVEKGAEEKKCTDVEETRREICSGAKSGGVASGDELGKGTTGAAPAANLASDGAGQAAAAQTQRKARRCWSPDLHRRFVNALQMLGGSQVATPKQIRELMKVDGLTNDEVKSHLQKYRLHTRRPISAPQAAASAPTPQLVVLGGIWVPPEYATTAAAAPGIYSGHPAAAHYCAAPVPQDYYSPAQQAAHHLHQLPPPPPQHHRVPAAAATAAPGPAGRVKYVAPEPEVRGSGDNSESIEDGEEEAEEEEEEEEGGRSDSSSWKGGGERALVPVGGDSEVSNGSDAALEI